jgi:hypothetical protein
MPNPKLSDTVELTSIYVQLASEDESYVTGQVYGAAGGGQP